MTHGGEPSVLMLGDGWAPDSAGGAARVIRELHRSLQPLLDVRTIVLGPLPEGAEGVRAAGDARAPLPRRLRSFARGAAEGARAADVVEAHFALYAS
ncbi:MAG TPA: hypothetical protein VF232_11900, partial [Gaiellaceae bacterium]